MNRSELQQLAEDRILDAEVLLDNSRWAAAYYLSGYAVECALKSSILAFVEKTSDVIFKDRRFSEKCWTHQLEDLIKQANLKGELDTAMVANATFASFWLVTINWSETSRYEQPTEPEARDLYDAITNDPDGVLIWLRHHW